MTKENQQSRIAIVIGASGGIGSAISSVLLEQGISVTGISTGTSHPIPKIQQHTCYSHQAIQLANPLKRRVAFSEIARQRPLVSAVFFAAGVPAFGKLDNISAPQTDSALEVNLKSVIDCARLLKPSLQKHASLTSQPGSMIVFGSEADSLPGVEGAIYCATKFGLRGLIESLRPEWSRDNLRISLISPGAVRTPFYEKTYFAPGPSDDNALSAFQCAKAAMFCMEFPTPGGIDQIRMSPKTRVFKKGSH